MRLILLRPSGAKTLLGSVRWRVAPSCLIPRAWKAAGSERYHSSLWGVYSAAPPSPLRTVNRASGDSVAYSGAYIRKYSNGSGNDENKVVYESPYGGLVTRLRSVSLLSAAAGSVGLPIVLAIKGTVPTGGFLALCLSFGTGTLASTAAIHYVFSPYVFRIERIPVRQCHTPSAVADRDENDNPPTPPQAGQAFLYKATTKSLFLYPVETVFDAPREVTTYKGLAKPLCNFVIRDQIYLFLHTESVYDNQLLQALPRDQPKSSGNERKKEARDKWADEEDEYFFGNKS